MNVQNIFEETGKAALITRINQLSPETQPLWGKMSVSQMLAHCSKPFETVYDPTYAEKYPRPNAFVRFILRLVIKPMLVNDKPYKKNMRTAPEFIVDDARDFAKEKARLIDFVEKTHADGAGAFEGRESHSFGPLTSKEWNMLVYKHTDHHLAQFGV